MKKLVYILGMLFIYATITYGQGITMTIGSATASVDDTVTVPISVTNFNNIGAVSLVINFNSALVSYLGVTNQPSSGNFTANASSGVLTIGWFNTTPLSIGNGKFLDIKFLYHGGSSNLVFNTSKCEVANPLGNPLVIDYVDGSILPAAVTKVTLPEMTAVAGNNITVPVGIENFSNVGAISLKIAFDPSVLTFNGVANQPVAGNFTSSVAGGVITIGWFDTNPMNVIADTLVNLNFTYNGGTSNLTFNTSDCEISNILGNTIFTEFVDGHVTFNTLEVPKFILDKLVSIPGNDVVFPLTVKKLQNVGAISLKVNYDAAVLTYTGFENGPTAGNFTANASNGVLTIGWFDTTPLNMDSAKFVDLKFSYIGGTSDLSFNLAECELSNTLGNPLFALYTDGKISPNPDVVPVVSLPVVHAIAGTSLLIPINVNNFQNVGAVSLKINYDPAVLTYTGITNLPSSGNFTANASGGVLTVGWFDTTPFGLDSTKLVDLQFDYIGGSSALAFNNANCEISNPLGNPLFSIYENGSVSSVLNTDPTLILANIESAPGTSITVPLTADNFQNVGAVSLKIQYDPSVISFTGVANQPVAGNFTANAAGGVLTIGWFDTNPFGQDSVKFVDLNFNFIGGNSSLAFKQTECEVSNTLGVPLFTNYVDGSVNLSTDSYPIVKIGNKAASVGDNVAVPITVRKFTEVGAISLKIQYNTSVLTFAGATNQPTAGNFTSNASGGVITLGWFNTTALGIDSGKFVDLHFIYNGGNSPVSFLTAQCEIAKVNSEVITFVQYINGSVQGNLTPVFTQVLPDTVEIGENQPFAFTYQATDPNPETQLIYKLDKSPTGAKIDSLSGEFKWTPTFFQAGPHEVSVIVSDGVLSATSKTSIIVVTNVNRSPVWTAVLNDTTINQMQTLSFQYKASDPDTARRVKKLSKSTLLKFHGVTMPSGATLDSLTGIFNWTPSYSQLGDFEIVVSVSDGLFSLVDSAVVKVIKTNAAPYFTEVLPDTTIEANNHLQVILFTYKAVDPNNDPLTFSFVGSVPHRMLIGSTTGRFGFTPGLDVIDVHTVIVKVSDGTLSAQDTVVIKVVKPTDVEPDPGFPKEFSLKQNYPNPFNPTTKIKFDVPEESKVVLSVYNLLGQRVAQLVNEVKSAGYYSVDFDASNLTSGIYLYKIEAKNYNSVRKMVIVK